MPDKRAFVGEVDPDHGARLWLLDGTGVSEAVEHVVNRSPDGLSWGYRGNGPADAALSILVFATGDRGTAERLHDAFMSEVLAKVPVNERFALPVSEVGAWLSAHGGRLGRQRPSPSAGPDAEGHDDPGGRGAALAERARGLDERERRLLEREVRVDAMAVTVGLLPEVEPAMWLPAEPVRRQLEALVFDTGDDIGVVAGANGLDARWATAVVVGAVTRVDLPHVRHVCEGLRCTPYDLWGTAGARSISHAYGPDAWPARTEPLLPVDEVQANGLSPSDDWPGVAGPEVGLALEEPAAPELVRDFGPGPLPGAQP